MSITEIYNQKCEENSDICQHLPTLKRYAEDSDIIVELGVRSIVSTWAFLMGKPKELYSVDIYHPSHYLDYDLNGCNLELVESLSKKQGTFFKFIQHDSRTVELPKCGLMFFDTLHTNEQLKAELKHHHKNVSKYMIFHDTVSYESELISPINNFLSQNKDWDVLEVFYNNNGLMVLKRKQ